MAEQPVAPRTPRRSDPAPTFVACCARSGSTLLRFLLDAHPELCCPGELDLAVLVATHRRIAEDVARAAGAPDPGDGLTRSVVDAVMEPLLEATGTARWCDKSLSNVFHLDQLAQIWPEGRFVLLHRNVMDFVENALAVSPWGLSEYGFAQVAPMSPTDSVVALAAYWVDRTARMLAFENANPGRCIRVRFEDLIMDPDGVTARLFEFLGAEAVNDIALRAFEVEHSTLGPADHEIWYTTGIDPAAAGHGARIPADHVAEPLRSAVNDLLVPLGYPIIDDDWGSGDAPLETYALPDGPPSARALVELRVVRHHDVLVRRGADLASRRYLDRAPSGTGGHAGLLVAIEAEVLDGLASGRVNLGSAVRSRSVRHYGELPSFFRDEHEVLEAVRAFVRDHLEDFEPAT